MQLKPTLKYTLLSLIVLIFQACSSSDEAPPLKADLNFQPSSDISIENLSVWDYGNKGNSADIKLSFTTKGNLNTINSIKLFIAKSTVDIDVNNAVSAFEITDIKSSTTLQLSDAINDIDGNPITNNQVYKLYVLAVDKDNKGALQASNVFTLINEIFVTTLALNPQIEANEDLLIDNEGSVFVCGGWRTLGTLFKITDDKETATVTDQISKNAVDATFNSKGELFVGSDKTYRISATGETSLYSNNKGGTIAIDNDDAVYALTYGSKTIFKLLPDGTSEVFLNHSLLNGPVGFEYDKIRDVFYVGNWNDGKIFSVNKSGEISEIIDLDGNIGRMSYLDDKIYVTINSLHIIQVISLDGEILTTIGTKNKSGLLDGSKDEAQFSNPNGIEITPDGRALYVASRSGGIRKIIL